jgi:hypothetical protein
MRMTYPYVVEPRGLTVAKLSRIARQKVLSIVTIEQGNFY